MGSGLVVRRVIDRLLAVVAFAPVGLDRLVHTALPALRRRSVVVPVALGLLILAAVPAMQAGFELVTTRAVPSEVIERRVGSATMLEVVGNAIDTGLAAGTDAQGRPLHWLALRDGPDRRSVLLVRTPEPEASLRTRLITARIETDPELVAAIRGALEARGAPAPVSSAVDRYLVETPEATDARPLADASEVATLPVGTVVRVELRLAGVGIAPCTVDADCDARALAGGQGTWLQRAVDPASGWSGLVETTYPPPVFKVDIIGEQVREPATIDALMATGPARVQLGWIRVLRVAMVEHDPALPIDRDWRGVLAMAAAGALLLFARRLPYPLFRHEASGARRTRPAGAVVVSGRALGHLALGDGPPLDADELPLRIAAGPAGAAPRVTAELPAGEVPLEVPVAAAGVSGMERGRLAWVRHSRPALWLHWYRTDLRVAFETQADRDAAAAALSTISDRPPPPPSAPPPPPPPRRRPPDEEPDEWLVEPVPTWRRPRPRGAR